MNTPRLVLFGWCGTHGKPDAFHHLCRVEIVSQFGVALRCNCPNHDEGDAA